MNVAPEDDYDEVNFLKMNRRDVNAKDAAANMDVQDNFALLRGGAVGCISASSTDGGVVVCYHG